MKILIPLTRGKIEDLPNQYNTTLINAIKELYPETEFYFDPIILWQHRCYEMDIIHIMWPDLFRNDMNDGFDFRLRLLELNAHGIIIITTCHNFHSHVPNNKYSDLSYDIAYELSDVIIHLGNYSKTVFEKKYPNVKHVLIPHHVYDNFYTKLYNREESLKHLHLPSKYKYVVCIGTFRTEEERQLVYALAKKLKNEDIRILAPSYEIWPKNNLTIRDKIHLWKKKKIYAKNGLYIWGKYIDNADLPYFYGVSDVSFVHRLKILNSGNLPLGFYMGNVVVGPNVGNVGEILKETGNPVFNPLDIDTAYSAILKAFNLAKEGKGTQNREYSLKNYSVHLIAEEIYDLYRELFKMKNQ